ncbi:hypothetical protein SDC9_04217 [bioreactor metagenome]|uniref:Uncharacterized protein n=1 Tax=bioreactor metagenome TaxID=1076179 RepID=A0A644SVM4_9ZZZZ|nr:hypothetical protein [Negativicutes bacterium]
MFHYVLGTATFTAGVVLISLGTDYGRVFDLSLSTVLGSLLVILGVARLKYAWLKKNHKLDEDGY